VQLDAGAVMLPFRTTANSVCCVVEQAGHLHVAARQPDRAQEPRRHGPLFQVSDRDLYARLGLLREECVNLAA
jgi:hypothetical protein